MAPVINYALPAMGICRNFPRALVFSSTDYAGLGIKHIHTLQEIARIKDVLQHTYTQTITGQLYRMSIEYLLLEIGMESNLTRINYNTYQHLATNCLIKNTWEFLQKNNIILEHDIMVPKNTTNDRQIMIKFRSAQPSAYEWTALNQCRLYLQAYYVSDLATASGKNLSVHAWEGKPRDVGCTNRCGWLNQGPPGRAAWEIWRKFLKLTILSTGMRLKFDLGLWICSDYDIWPWYYSESLEGLIHMSKDGALRLHTRYKIPYITNHNFSNTYNQIESLPRDIKKALVRKSKKNSLWLIDTGQFAVTATVSHPMDFGTYLEETELLNVWCFDSLEFSHDYEPLLKEIELGQVVLVSDGSYDPRTKRGAAA
jgi:hypothetical protein